MNKVVVAAAIVLVATIGVSAYALSVLYGGSSGVGGPGTGTLNIYLSDAPPHNATLKYLLVNVTSVTLKYSSNLTETSSTSSSTSSNTTASSTATTTSTTSEGSGESESRFVYNVSSSLGTNVNLTSLQGKSLLLGSPKVPAGNVTGIVLGITGAEAFWTNGNHSQLKVVADGKLMVNVHFTIQSDGSTNLNLDVNPGDIHVSPGNETVLRPVVHVQVISTGPSGTETTETTQSETNSTSSA